MKSLPYGIRRWGGALALTGMLGFAGGCASAASVSPQQEAQIGAQASADVNRQLPIVNNSAISSYINELGNSIAQRADQRGIRYHFYVVNSDVVNAFALPGGYVYLNRGLIERAGNMSEVAGVLAHEIGHVVERHGIERMARANNVGLGANLAYILLGRQPGAIEQAAVGAGLQGAFIAPHSRAAEREADAVAIRYLVASGINPNGMVTMFEKLQRERRSSPNAVAQWFSTHPLEEERIQNTRNAIAQLPGSTSNMTTNTQAFQTFQQRLRQLPAAPRRD